MRLQAGTAFTMAPFTLPSVFCAPDLKQTTKWGLQDANRLYKPQDLNPFNSGEERVQRRVKDIESVFPGVRRYNPGRKCPCCHPDAPPIDPLNVEMLCNFVSVRLRLFFFFFFFFFV